MKDINKRRLLKALAGGGSVIAGSAILPVQWKQPVVDSVVLPAHAQTSVFIPEGTWEGSLTFAAATTGSTTLPSIGKLVFDSLVPPAHACLSGSLAFQLQVQHQRAILLSGSTQLGTVLIHALVVQFLLIEIFGQLSNVRAEYRPEPDDWDVSVKGQNNANACAGINARGFLTRVSGP